MPLISADPVRVTGSQRRELNRLLRAGRTEQRLVLRATIVLWAADRCPSAAIAPGVTRECGDRPQVAGPLERRAGRGVVGRRETVGSATEVHPGAGHAGQGDGLHTPEGVWGAVGAVVVSGTGPPRRHRRDLCVDLAGHDSQVAPRTPSSPGSISRGSSSPIRTSPLKLAVCSTCMPGCGMGNRWASTTM